MVNKLILFGTGHFARVAYVYLSKDSPYVVHAFTVHGNYIRETECMGLPITPFENLEATYPPDQYAMFVAVGYRRVNKARAEIYETCKRKGYKLITYVSSKATHWGEVEIGDNCFIFENNVIQPFVKIGNDVILWSGNHIGHDSTIEDHCFIASHAVISGGVTIGPYCFVGVNATIRDGISVAPEGVIGAGAFIARDTTPHAVYRGRRTRPWKRASTELKSFT